MLCPPIAKREITKKAVPTARYAARCRSFSVRFFVTERKMGVFPGGSIMTNIVTTTSPNKFIF
jgi:hypothetical protein